MDFERVILDLLWEILCLVREELMFLILGEVMVGILLTVGFSDDLECFKEIWWKEVLFFNFSTFSLNSISADDCLLMVLSLLGTTAISRVSSLLYCLRSFDVGGSFRSSLGRARGRIFC